MPGTDVAEVERHREPVSGYEPSPLDLPPDSLGLGRNVGSLMVAMSLVPYCLLEPVPYSLALVLLLFSLALPTVSGLRRGSVRCSGLLSATGQPAGVYDPTHNLIPGQIALYLGDSAFRCTRSTCSWIFFELFFFGGRPTKL